MNKILLVCWKRAKKVIIKFISYLEKNDHHL